MPRDHSYSDQDVYRLGVPINTALVCLPVQERVLLEQMGGVFPEREHDLHDFSRVLDLACGTGSWAVRVAYENPQIEVSGIERHRQLVDYASGLAEAQRVANARFTLLTNEITRLPFPDQHFDLVNAHFLFSLLHAAEWPTFVQECLRVTRPGGYLRLSEPEWGITTSPALEHLGLLFLRGLKQAGHSPSPDGRHLGIVPLLAFFLQQAGATEVARRAYVIEPFLAFPLARNPAPQLELIAQVLRPLILKQNIASQEKVTQLLQEATVEVEREDFCGVTFVLSVCGQKPGA